ncbi:MAG: hypothetical protein A2W90_05635 [Bacteroidetes bacterium GWF2_42_66]|nr:MAG: hypothetical protein A2W92_01015 [Bacteroidetes bacterium GWA2_42_15]OFY03526.1 MAG: hypothetical protein A2W89_18355 [Bacteroidetes bacterium GWE2_42_39]OFY45892.1 MAG: hypothetical protein A2W90_05635 [Bacteroidetes bacterium GWF2_42_66]HBL75134.1 hypothetical protein [Prolixibacteraceae bacterium]HCR91117.1 hypothetical protein [Prolixibacteraceae bacterium]
MKLILIFILSFIFQTFFPSETKSVTGPNKSIEIIIPAKGSSIDCTKSGIGKKAIFTVKGNSINLKVGEFITVFIRPKEGKNWIRVSKSVKIVNDYSGLWSFDINAEISKKCKVADLSVFVSSCEITDSKLYNEAVKANPNIICRSQEGFTIVTQ